MLSGLISTVDEIEYTLAVAGGGSNITGGFYGGTGELTTFYTPDYLSVAAGIRMQNASYDGSLNSREYSLDITGITSQTRSSGTSGTASSKVRLMNVKLYMEGDRWSLRIGEIRWYVENSLEYQKTTATTLVSVMTPVPSAIPLIGMFPRLQCAAAGDPVLAISPQPPDFVPTSPFGSTEQTFSSTTTGGWRVKIDGVWYAPPVNAPSLGTSLAQVSGSDTSAVTVEAVTYGYQDTDGVGQEKGKASTAFIVPEDLRSFSKLENYEALVLRYGFARLIKRVGVLDTAGTWTGETSRSNPITDSDYYAAQSQFLQTVGNSAATIEGPITAAHPMPYTTGGSVYDTGIDTFTFHAESHDAGSAAVWATSSQVSGALKNADLALGWYAEFVNTWAHPFWSYGLWFPPDGSASSVRWDLQGGDSDIEYWYNLRQQYNDHPALPSGENTQRRVNVTTEPINQNGIVGLSQAVNGMPCWWGNTRIQVETEEFPSEFTTNSSSAARFTFKDGEDPGTGSVGASTITLTVGDSIEFDLSSFTDYPFMATTLSDRLKVSWADSNIGTVKLWAEGAEGSRVQIGPSGGITSGTTYRIPFGDSEKWATSAGADFGAGYLTDDYTPDAGVIADDITAATLGDEERISSFGLLPGFSPVKIIIEITRAGTYTGAVSISHPTFYQAPWSDARAFHESGLVSTILFKDGPMVRYGALSFFDYLLDTPLSVPVAIAQVTNKTTIGDLWCWENVYLRGVSALTGLLARMEAEYIENEEFPAGVIEHLWRYSDGESYFLDSLSGVVNSDIGPRLWYLNTWRNVPPLSMFPQKKRLSSDGWDLTGDYGGYAYSDICNKHPHIVPGTVQPELLNGSTNVLTMASAPSGWSVGVFDGAVDNNEAQDWTLRWNGTDWFTMRPWRGSASIFGLPTFEPSGNVSIDVEISNTLAVRTIVSSNLLQYEFTDTGRVWQTVDTGKECKWARVAIDDASRERHIFIVLQTMADEIELYRCSTFGDTLTLVRSYGSGSYPSIMIAPDGVRQIVWIEGGAVKSVIEDQQDNIIEAEFTAYGAADDLGIDIAYDRKGTGDKGAVLVLVEGGTVKALDSDDGGKTFS